MFALSFQLGHIHAFRHRNSTVDEQLRMRESNSAEVALHSTAVSEFVLQRGEMPNIETVQLIQILILHNLNTDDG